MRFFFLLALLVASTFAAPTGDFDALADDFGHQEATEATVAPVDPKTEAPVETENEPETPVETTEPASEAPVEPATEEPKEPETEPEAATEAPEVEAPETTDEAPVETVEPEVATEAPVESPVEETEAPAPEAPVDTPAAETETETETDDEPVASETDAPAADDDDDASDSTSGDSEESPAASPVDNEEPTETEAAAEDETAAAAEPETVPEATAEPEASADEAEPAAATEKPVVAIPTPTGASAIVDGVTVRFALQATWVVDGGERRRGYVVKITNGSEKEVCGVTFSNNAESTDVWNLTVNEDSSFSTKDLRLAPGQTANQFGYVSAARSRPTIHAVTFC